MRNWSKHTRRVSSTNPHVPYKSSLFTVIWGPTLYLIPPFPFFLFFPLLFFSRASVTTFTRSEHDHQGGMMHMHSSYRVGLDMGAMISQEQLFKHREIVGTPSVQHKPPSVSSAVKLHS